MKQNNKKFNNAMHKFVGVLDKYGLPLLKVETVQGIMSRPSRNVVLLALLYGFLSSRANRGRSGKF